MAGPQPYGWDSRFYFLDDVYYFIFGAKKISVLAFGEQLAKTLDEGEVEALSFVVMWSGEQFNYESNDEVRWSNVTC